MALYRPPNICPFCKQVIQEIHNKQEGVPFMLQNIGDNFLRYEDHKCPEGTIKPSFTDGMTNDEVLEWERYLISLQGSNL